MSYERRRVKTGRVVSDKMDRTVVVQVEWRSPHRLYKKPIRRMSKFKVHDPENISMVGDLVQVVESRPRSKTKRWRLVQVLQRSETVDLRPEEIGQDAGIAEMPAPAADTASEPDVQMDMVAEPAAEIDAATGPVSEGEAEPVAEIEPAAEPEPEGEAEPVAEIEPAAEPEPEGEAEPVAEIEPAAEPEPEGEAEPVAEIEPAAEPEPEE